MMNSLPPHRSGNKAPRATHTTSYEIRLVADQEVQQGDWPHGSLTVCLPGITVGALALCLPSQHGAFFLVQSTGIMR